jgi:hypothetical protein
MSKASEPSDCEHCGEPITNSGDHDDDCPRCIRREKECPICNEMVSVTHWPQHLKKCDDNTEVSDNGN